MCSTSKRQTSCWLSRDCPELHTFVCNTFTVVVIEVKADKDYFFSYCRWFTITLSTGVLSILLHQIPYHAHWLDIISNIFFVLNVTLFLLFTSISALRYTIYPDLFPAMLHHPHQSLFLATFPIGFAIIINMIALVCVPAWGQSMAIFAWVLWWIDSVLALIACLHMTWVM